MDGFLGEIRIFSSGYVPNGWLACNGAVLPIAQYTALFSLLGSVYGGNGSSTFALPDLRGRVPVAVGSGLVQGQAAGEEYHTLSGTETAQHYHSAMGSQDPVTDPTPDEDFWGVQTGNLYANNSDGVMASQTVSAVGGQPHENRSPYLVLNFCICNNGYFPQRS